MQTLDYYPYGELKSPINYKQQVESLNALYAKRARQVPTFFPPSLLEKTSSKFQELATLFVGATFVIFAIVNLIRL